MALRHPPFHSQVVEATQNVLRTRAPFFNEPQAWCGWLPETRRNSLKTFQADEAGKVWCVCTCAGRVSGCRLA